MKTAMRRYALSMMMLAGSSGVAAMPLVIGAEGFPGSEVHVKLHAGGKFV